MEEYEFVIKISLRSIKLNSTLNGGVTLVKTHLIPNLQ